MRSGMLRHRLTFQTPVEASDGKGPGGTVTWTDTITDWPAEMWSVKASERVEAARNKQNAIFRWHCRYNASIIPSMRIKWVNGATTHYQEITAINALDQRNREIEIFAEEKT